MNYLDDNQADPLNPGKQMQRFGSPAGGSQPFGSPDPASPAPPSSAAPFSGGMDTPTPAASSFAQPGGMASQVKVGAQMGQAPSQPIAQPAQPTAQPAQPAQPGGIMGQKPGATMQQPAQQTNINPQAGQNPAKQQGRRYYGEAQQ